MGVIPDEIKGSGGGDGRFLKAAEFENAMRLTVEGFEKIKADNADFGANDKDFLFTSGRLALGETFRYMFKNEAGEEKVLDSKSATFFISFSKCNPEVGDMIEITKSGTGRNTKYDISIV